MNYDDLDLDRILRVTTTEYTRPSATMPVGSDASRKAGRKKTARGKRVSKEIGKTRDGIRHRRRKSMTADRAARIAAGRMP